MTTFPGKSCLALILLLGGVGVARDCIAEPETCDVQRNAGAHALDEIRWKQLNRIYEDVAEQRYDEAADALHTLLAHSGRDPYLKAILYQALAQVEWSRENYDASLSYFEQAVELNALPDQAHFALMYQLAQLYFMQERNQEALAYLDLWFCKSPPEKIGSGAYVLKASIHVKSGEYDEAVTAIETAIALDDDPKESWYQLKLAAHYELEQISRAAETLKSMISRWPENKLYWKQLSQVYLGLQDEEKALAVMALAYRRNLLDEQTDLLSLSTLYSHSQVPFKAAEVLEKGIMEGIVTPDRVHWLRVADSWYAAEELENALSAYRAAGAVSPDGDLDLRRAYILVDLEHWESAVQALDEALSKDGLDERSKGEAYLLRGVAQFHLENFDSANSDLVKASRYELSKDAAQQWINHLDEQRRRQAS